MKKLSIKYCARYLHQAGACVAVHSHDGCELVYYASGSGRVQIGGDEIPYQTGMVGLTLPGTPHGEVWDKETEVWCIVFKLADTPGLQLPEENLYSDVDSELFPLIKALFHEQQTYGIDANEIPLCYLEIILRKLWRQHGDTYPARQKHENRLDSIFYYLQDYYNTDISFAALAAEAGYSYDRFRHLFKERYHISPKQVVLNKRLETAKLRLREQPQAKIEAIARECGFRSASQFNAIFKKIRGITPREYRRLYQVRS